MTETEQIDVSTPVGHDLQRFTEQQIEDYCEKMVAASTRVPSVDTKMLRKAVKIIKQLQAEG